MQKNTTALLTVLGQALLDLGAQIMEIVETDEAAEAKTEAAPAKATRKRTPAKKAAQAEPEDDDDQDDDDQDDDDQDDDDQDDDDQDDDPAPKAKSKAKPAAKGKAQKITLEQLQELAAQLLEAGQRKQLKSILTETGAKTLSTADEGSYPELLEALTEAVAELED